MICGAVPVRTKRDVEKGLASGLPCLEFRLDYARDPLDRDLLKALEAAAAERTAIFTVRRAEEGGSYAGPEDQRLKIYSKLLELGPKYIDVEASSPIAGQLAASKGKTALIASRHDTSGTPPLEVLLRWAREAAAVGDLVKVVTYAGSPADGLRVLSLIGALEKPTVAFAMGPAGAYTRAVAALLGSPIAYVSLGEATAPGQYSADGFYAALLSLGLRPEGEGLPSMRAALDWIDGALMHLLKARLEVCRDMGRLKKAAGLPIYDDEREAQVLKRAGDFKQIFEMVVQMCKAVQLVA